LRESCTALFKALRDRHSRRPFVFAATSASASASASGSASASASSGGSAGATASVGQSSTNNSSSSGSAADAWVMGGISPAEFEDELLHSESGGGTWRVTALLRELPFVLSFEQRVRLFYRHIQADKEEYMEQAMAQAEAQHQQMMMGGPGMGGGNPFAAMQQATGVQVNIRRKTLLEDG
jgi:hypothetical protein